MAKKKKATKKSTKKTTKKSTKKGKAKGKKKVAKKVQPAKTDAAIRAKAKSCGTSPGQYKVLVALNQSPNGLTYKQIYQKTGIYNPLTAMLRADHEDSLCDKGYVKEEVWDIEGKDVLTFKILKKGKKALEKSKKVS